MVKLRVGVVIFKDEDYLGEGFAALQWVARTLSKNSSQVFILLIEKVGQPKESRNTGQETAATATAVAAAAEQPQIFKRQKLLTAFEKAPPTFEKCIKEIGIKNVECRYYKGTNTFQEILKGAIKELKLDTLVLGMAAVGSNPTRHIDLQVDSECSIVLAKTKPMEMPLKTATPAVATAPANAGATNMVVAATAAAVATIMVAVVTNVIAPAPAGPTNP